MIDLHRKFAVCCAVAIALGAVSGALVFLISETPVNKYTDGRGFRNERIQLYTFKPSTLAHRNPREYKQRMDNIGKALGNAFWQSTSWGRSVLSYPTRAPYHRIVSMIRYEPPKVPKFERHQLNEGGVRPVRHKKKNTQQLYQPIDALWKMRKRQGKGAEDWWEKEEWWQKKIQEKSDDEFSDFQQASKGSKGPQGIYADSSSPQNDHSSGLVLKDDVLKAVMTEFRDRDKNTLRARKLRQGTQNWFERSKFCTSKRSLFDWYYSATDIDYDSIANETTILACREIIENIVVSLATTGTRKSARGIFGPISDSSEVQPWCLMVGGWIDAQKQSAQARSKVKKADVVIRWDPPSDGAVPIEVLGDNLRVIRLINKEAACASDSWAESVVAQINGMLDEAQRSGLIIPRQSGLPWCRHIYREFNSETDALANYALRSNSPYNENANDLPRGFPTAVKVYFDGSWHGQVGSSLGSKASVGWVMWATYEKYGKNEILDHRQWYRIASAAAPLGELPSQFEAELNGAFAAISSLTRWARERRELH